MKIQKVLGCLSVVVLGTAMFSFAQDSRKTTTIRIKSPTIVGDVELRPGKYEVKEVNSETEHYVEFSRLSWQDVPVDAGSDMGMVPEPKLVETPVARLNYALQALDTPVARTELIVSANRTILKIRGEKLEYLF